MKKFSLLLLVFFIYSGFVIAQDTSMAVSSNGNVGIGTSAPASKLDVNGTLTISGPIENELNRSSTGDANLVPIAFANVNADGTLNPDGTTSNVSLFGHAAGSGNYYFIIDGEQVYYLSTMCVVSLVSDVGEISWSSSGGGAQLYVATYNSSGVKEDKRFSFIVYKK